MPARSNFKHGSKQEETLEYISSLVDFMTHYGKQIEQDDIGVNTLLNLNYCIKDADLKIDRIKARFYNGTFVPDETNVESMKYILSKYSLIHSKILSEFQSIYDETAVYTHSVNAACSEYHSIYKLISERNLAVASEGTINFLRLVYRRESGYIPGPVKRKVRVSKKPKEIDLPPLENKRLKDTREHLETLTERVTAEAHKAAFSNRSPQPKSDFRLFRN